MLCIDPYWVKQTSALIVAAIVLSLPLIARGKEGVGKETNKAEHVRPNIVLILADDLGYGDLGCYGQQRIKTPRLDRMAAEGMRFTQFYAGSTVCAPSRCVLMTGKHLGHCRVRGNGRGLAQSLRPEQDSTVADLLKSAGYATALVGKWGLGDEGLPGLPRRCGFDHFFGYLNQVHAHNYYPEFLWRNETKQPLGNEVRHRGRSLGGVATKRVDYSHDLFAQEALKWIEAHKQKPFFLYLALTIPHANNEAGSQGMEVPELGEYAERDWPAPQKGTAAMITRMDRDVGRLLDKLAELGIDDDTVVMFSSDNGPHREGGNNPDFFDSAGPLRGIKRDLYEGGIRVPMIVRWPGKVQSGAQNDHVGYFGDLMATCAELSGSEMPEGLDSVSFLPTLLGKPDQQKQHDYLYWEFYERGGRRAIRWGKWKGVRPRWHDPLELYDVNADVGEKHNVAEQHPEVVEQIARMMDQAREPSKLWKVPGKR